MRLKNKIAVITGGSAGIGQATAQLFAEHGAKVAIADLDEVNGKTVVDGIINQGRQALFNQVDVSNEEQVKDWIGTVVKQWGTIDILVNNAAAFVFGTVEELTTADWDKALGVNVKGYAYCARYVAPVMRKQKKGAIVNMASISAFIAQPGFVPYNTTKGAIIQLSRCLAYDLGEDGIRVNCVCPGTIETQATLSHAQSVGLSKKALVKEISAHHLIKRLGQPREVAQAVLFLASDEASFITGTHLIVDGGHTTH